MTEADLDRHELTLSMCGTIARHNIVALIAEVRKLGAALTQETRVSLDYARQRDQQRAYADAAVTVDDQRRAEIARLRAALAPFAAYADHLDRYGDGQLAISRCDGAALSIDHCRLARTALAPPVQ